MMMMDEMEGETSLCSQSIGDVSLPASMVPSALRRGKYTENFYARSDIDTLNISSSNLPIGGEDDPETLDEYQKKRNQVVPTDVLASGGICQTGRILSRTSRRALFLRQWQSVYWVHVYPANLILFPSEKDFLTWRSNGGCVQAEVSNDSLIKFSINFDAMGLLKQGADKQEKAVPKRVVKYAMGEVHTKKYKKSGPFLHCFKVERWTDVGTNVIAAFASADQEEIRALRRIVKECIKISSRSPKPKKKHEAGAWTTSETSVLSGMSEVTGRSATSGDNVRVRHRRRRKHGRPGSSVVSGDN